MMNSIKLTLLVALGAGSVFGASKHEELLVKMTLDEKVGQMVQVDFNALRGHEEDIARYYLGSVLNGGSADPLPVGYVPPEGVTSNFPASNSPEAWRAMVDQIHLQAQKTRLKIPLVYGVDAVHGHNNVDGAVIFPHNIGLGATRNPELVEQAGRVTAVEVAATGMNWAFSPCVAVVRNERWGRSYESFGETPELVGQMGAALTRGLQSTKPFVLACPKHYVGDGGTVDGKDQGDTVCTEDELRKIHLAPYKDTFDAGARSVMVSYSSWNGEKLHGHRYLMDDVLRGDLNFTGFTLSDWAAIDQLPGDYKSDIEQSVNAGIDMVMVPKGPGGLGEGENDYVSHIRLLKELVAEGKISMQRIDDAVRNILRVKEEMGLFDTPVEWPAIEQIGCAEHRAVARQCVRESVVLLKNENKLLPLSKTIKRLSVIGRGADDLGMQCGGWTISWQGNGETMQEGTTLLEAIRTAVSTETTLSLTHELAGSDAAVVVVGEKAYAEGQGDRSDLALTYEELGMIFRCRQAGVPVVLMVMAGRPLLIDEVLPFCDAAVVVWLPGTEGQGMADVLFGDFPPVGKLPCSWPKSMDQIPINVGDREVEPLFEYGFGLEYE